MIYILPITALLVSLAAYYPALWFARRHKILDKPDVRKLQKEPVPVFGGIVVLVGILVALQLTRIWNSSYDYDYVTLMMVTLWLVGVTDDIRGLRPSLRFLIELGLIWLMIWYPNSSKNGVMISSFMGLWGIHTLTPQAAIPLTLIAGVGIINSINLIDGVDGYSSGFGIVTGAIFAAIFHHLGEIRLEVFCAVVSAALIPFWFHNVYGHRTKMFLGDGGSLVLGIAMAYAAFHLLDESCFTHGVPDRVGFVALSLAMLSVPVFDTLRVMTARMLSNESPFHPDKTHYHHVLIRLGLTHLQTSTTLIGINTAIIGIWWLSYLLGAGIDLQFYIVLALGLCFAGSYYILDKKTKQ